MQQQQQQVGTVERSEHAKIFGLCTELMETIQDIPIPVICQVDSLATAAGCQLVASCDIAVASERATFCTPGLVSGPSRLFFVVVEKFHFIACCAIVW